MGILTLFAVALLAAAPAPAASAASALALAATPQFRHYNIDQGLPSSNVYTVVQDRRGVIWMGTITGLARFDGTRMKTYRHVPGDPSSLASDDVSAVLADSEGRLWAGGEGSGVNLYVPATDGFRHFKHDPDRADSLSGNDVMAMAEGRDGTLWVGTYGHGLNHMTSPGHFEHLTHDRDDPHSLASDNVLSLYSRADGTLWIGTDKGVDVRKPDGTLVHVRFDGLAEPAVVWGINGDGHELRAATTVGMFVIGADGVARRLLPSALPHTVFMTSVRDARGDLWAGSTNGLYLVRQGRVTWFPPRPLVPGGQPGQLIWDLMLDSEGGLWVATRVGGVAYLGPDWHDFSHYSHRPDDDGSLSYSRIRALAADSSGSLWVGGGLKQLDKLNPVTGAVTHYGNVLKPDAGNILSMASAGHHGLWLGFGHELGLLQHGDLQLIKASKGSSSYRRMVSTPNGTLYVARIGNGVYRVDRRTLAMTPLMLAFDTKLDRETSSLLMHGGHLWRASHAGVSRLRADSTQLVPVAGVATGRVAAMTISGTDLWLVRPKGLEHYRLRDQHATLVRRVDAAAGWPGIVTYSIVVDQRGRVWLFGAAGLWRYDPATNRFTRYGQSDGLPSPEFTSKQVVRMGADTVFAGTLNGVVGFHPARITDHARQPKVAISSIVTRRDDQDITLSPDDHHLHLRWNDRDLRITVHALSYIAPNHNHYRFFLSGLDTGWVGTGTRGVRELAGLDAGHYTLKVQAAGPSGAWGTLATPLVIDVAAPPWARPWAWLVYALVVLLVGYLVITAWRRRQDQRHRVQLAEQRRRMAEQASAAKTRFLATLSHEIRTPMTGVLGMAELLHDSAGEPRQRGYASAIRHSGELLLRLVNDALDMARIEAGRFELEPVVINPRAVLTEVRQLLHGQAGHKGLELTVEADASVPAHVRGDALRIKQILLNLTNNAIKFTARGDVRVCATYADGALHLAVSDSGPGISAADRERLFQRFEQADSPERSSGTGLGLAICRELVALMNGRITLDSTPGKGSRFDVMLPLPVVTDAAPAPTAPAPPASTTARRLLLVEDDATVARVISGLLEARGHHVVHAADGLRALGELERGSFDALLLDLDLPGMDGYQLAATIRRREDGRALPVAAITARSGGDEEQRAKAAGMDAFMRKPLTGEQLAGLIERLCCIDTVS